jgi:5-methylcytosine-specific restriction protein A
MSPPRPCTWPGCGELTTQRRCPRHLEQERREVDARRGSSSQRGYGSKWQKAREIFLKENPLCAICERTATVVDHIVPHKGDQFLFWDQANWQPLCKSCHDSKTAMEDRRWQ